MSAEVGSRQLPGAGDPTPTPTPPPVPAVPPAGPGRRRTPSAAPNGGGRARAVFWLTAVGGWAIIGYGLRGLFHHRIDTRPTNLAKFAVGGALIHDLLFAPLVLLVGVFVARTVRGRWRPIVQAALITSGCLALFSYPLVRGFGHANRNPTSEPYNYAVNLAVVLGVVWAAATVALLLRLRAGNRDKGPERTATVID